MPEKSASDPLRTVTPIPPSGLSTIDVTAERQSTADLPAKQFAGPGHAPVVPGYVITGEIAKGGMGCVYAARDLTLTREVAIKTLLPGSDGARFIREAQFTARLPHPNIPPVHALGTLSSGAPYLVMKLVRGQTLAEFLKRRSSAEDDLPRFIQIFEKIAQAVGFAHAQQIIHRDLKPLNVMVGAFGEVQVMDWGLAKALQSAEGETDPNEALDSNLRPQTLLDQTRAGAVLGTPGYMAPEQARGDTSDARADVFALGAVLATILTGQPAFVGTTVRETIAKTATADLVDVLQRLANCHADPELLAIARHCLAESPDSRPDNGQAVAASIAGYRAGVEARLQKAETERARAETRSAEQAKRWRTIQWSVSVVAAVLLLGIAGTTWGFVTARHNAEGERLAKIRESKRADGEARAKRTAEQKQQEAEANLAFAKKGNEILGSVFLDLMPTANYGNVGEFSRALRQNLDKAVAALQENAVGRPQDVAEMQMRLGLSLSALGDSEKAIELLQKSKGSLTAELGESHPDSLQCANFLTRAYCSAGKADLAVPLGEEALRLCQANLGEEHLETLTAMNNLGAAYAIALRYDQATPLIEKSFELHRRHLGANHLLTQATKRELSVLYHHNGQRDLALKLSQEAVDFNRQKLGSDHPITLHSIAGLASIHQDTGNQGLAISLLEESVKLMKSKSGVDHPETLTSMTALGISYQHAGKHGQAISILEEVRKYRIARYGVDHLDTLTVNSALAISYHMAGQLELALPLQTETLQKMTAKLGPDHPETLTSMNAVANFHKESGRIDLALPMYEKVLKLRKAKLGPRHQETLTSMNNLALTYQDVGKLDLALPLMEETLEFRRKELGPDHPGTLTSMNNLGLMYEKKGQLQQALALIEQAFKLRKDTLGPDHPDTLTSMNNLAICLMKGKQLEAALPLFEESLRQRKAILGPTHPQTLTSLNNLATCYRNAKKPELAIPLFEEIVTIRKAKLGAEHTETLSAIAALGMACKQAKLGEKAAEAFQTFASVYRKKLPKDDPGFASLLAQLALDLFLCDQFATAEEFLRECLASRERTHPNAWNTDNTRSMLGQALFGQKKFAEAEPLLIAGYEGMKSKEASIPPEGKVRIPEALDRLVDFYSSVKRPEEAGKYRQLRAAYPEVQQPLDEQPD